MEVTEIERKALALVNEVRAEAGHSVLTEHNPGVSYGCCWETLCRAIEQHEAFRKEVSDAVEERFVGFQNQYGCLQRFIITKPVDPWLLQARELAADMCDEIGANQSAADVRNGQHDDDLQIQAIAAALRAAYEKGKAE